MSAELEWDDSKTLVDRLLEEQRSLSAVEVFSAAHDAAGPDASRYEALIPSGLPGLGEQFAFRVDLDVCTGCKACVTACHNLNGLEEGEAWREVGLIETAPEPRVDTSLSIAPTHQQTITTACHHCEEPACLSGCPVRAYDKDATTGIVRHLDDQCIGCRYCELMCPYEVPTFSKRLGIVRKCDMCHERLSEGEAPACVQGCPNQAISIGVVEKSGSHSARLLEVAEGAMPESSWTRPTTQYRSLRRDDAVLRPPSLGDVEPSEGHTPLALMLVLTQVAIGTVLLDGLLSFGRSALGYTSMSSVIALTVGTSIGLAGLGASILHLGRPQWAFRAFLGLRTSWMSREIVALGGFAGLLLCACLFAWMSWGAESGPFEPVWKIVGPFSSLISASAIGSGLVGLFCSIQIYVATGRPLWRFDRTALRFGSTVLSMGISVVLLGLVLGAPEGQGVSRSSAVALVVLLAGFSLFRLRAEAGRLLEPRDGLEATALERTRELLMGALGRFATTRRWTLVLSGILLPIGWVGAIFAGAPVLVQASLAVSILAVGIGSDLLERSLFFRSEAMPAMPGSG